MGKFMSGDYETLEINQPKISYFHRKSENNTEWLDEMINKIEDMKTKYRNFNKHSGNNDKEILIEENNL